MYDAVEPGRAPAVGSCEVWSEPLDKDLGPAVRPDATETTDADIDDDASTGNRQIGQSTRVAAIDSKRGLIAAWAPGQGGDRPGCDGHPNADLDMIDDKASRNYGRGCRLRGIAGSPTTEAEIHQLACTEVESDPKADPPVIRS